ncbi:20562_t:CDS:2 [Rhizophagus irregularis]|nr:20562_t:CDS:2 [Rhizophagus irregularis]
MTITEYIIGLKLTSDRLARELEFVIVLRAQCGSRYEWNNEENPGFIPEWDDWEELFATSKPIGRQRQSGIGEKKTLEKFVYSLSSELRLEIWPDGINIDDRRKIKVGDNADDLDKFRCGLLLQDKDSIVDYYSNVKRCNDSSISVKNISEENSLEDYHKKIVISPWDFPLDVLVKMLIQAEKGSTTKLILQPCLNFISQQQRLAIYMTPIVKLQESTNLTMSNFHRPAFENHSLIIPSPDIISPPSSISIDTSLLSAPHSPSTSSDTASCSSNCTSPTVSDNEEDFII